MSWHVKGTENSAWYIINTIVSVSHYYYLKEHILCHKPMLTLKGSYLWVSQGEWWWWFKHSVVSNSVTPWTVAHQAPLSMGFSRQEYWRGLPFSPPGDLPYPGMGPSVLALQADALPLSHQRSPSKVRGQAEKHPNQEARNQTRRAVAVLWPLLVCFMAQTPVLAQTFQQRQIDFLERLLSLPQSIGSLQVGHDWATSLSCIGEGNGNPLQCSCLGNPRDGDAFLRES